MTTKIRPSKQLNATGTPSSSTYLRGDDTWATLTGGGDMTAAVYDPAAIAQQVVGTTATQTMTNKRITKRVLTDTSTATPAINTDSYDKYRVTALAVNITGFTMTGTPVSGDRLTMELITTAARTVVFGSSFENGTVNLPSTLPLGTTDLTFEWNTVTSKWRCIAGPILAVYPNSGSVVLASTLNSTATACTEANLGTNGSIITGFSATIPAGKSINLRTIPIFRTPVTTTGGCFGLKVINPTGANGSVQGSWWGGVAISGASIASELERGSPFNVAANTNSVQAILGTGVSATTTDHMAHFDAILKNQSTNTDATVEVWFGSEVAASAVTLQIGSSFTYSIS